MNRQRTLRLAPALATALAACFITACGDGPIEPAPLALDLSRYVAIGNSVSMGWADDGVNALTQGTSWPRQLAGAAGASFTQPLIATPGCQPPLATPLASFKRIDNTSAGELAVCSPNAAQVTLPTGNLAIEGALADDALNETPENATDRPVVARVLPAGKSQVTAMRALKPTFVSVDFGGNEVLPVQVGVVAPGVTFVPIESFNASYARIIDSVKATGAKALLMGLPRDLRQFPTLRTGPEIASQRAAFAAFNVTVNADCDASPNYLFVRGKVLLAIATGAGRARAGAGPFDLSCADVPGTADFVLTPGDIAFVNDLLSRMNATITAHAVANRYALSSLEALYATSKVGVPFNLQAFLASSTPYGPSISLDGVHPTPAGQSILARAAITAINLAYGSTLTAPF